MLGLMIENNVDDGEEGSFSSMEFEEGWTASEIEEWASDNDIDLDECTITLINEGSASHDWSNHTQSWDLSEKEELCEMLSPFFLFNGWKLDREKEEALYLYLENGHFNYAYLGSFKDAYIGKYETEQECALELNEGLVAAVEAAGYNASYIDGSHLAEERGADYTFAVTGGVHCFRYV